MSRHVPPTSLQFSFLHFCFRFQYHWDSFRYPARPRIYTLFQMGDSSPSSPILLCPCLCSFSRFFLYIFFEIYINFHSFLSFFLLFEFDSLNFSFSFSPPLPPFFIFRRLYTHTDTHTYVNGKFTFLLSLLENVARRFYPSSVHRLPLIARNEKQPCGRPWKKHRRRGNCFERCLKHQ